jgi:tetratricopeptide (TPR) repeat protein
MPLVNAERYLEVDPERSGRSSRPPSPYQTGWWLRLRVEEKKGALQFTLLTDRARAESSSVSTGRDLVDDAVKQAVTSNRYDCNVSRILFEMLLPRSIKDRLRDKVNVVLVLDGASARYPWELMAQRVGRNIEPLAKGIGIIRQFVALNPPRLRSTRVNRALVIGNPPVAPPWMDLPHAAEEAEELGLMLNRSGYECDVLTGAKATVLTILARVFDTEYRIIHIAAHGYARKKDDHTNQTVTGIVIGNNRFLTAAQIAQVEPVPDLVFLNCCYAGAIEVVGFAPQELAGSIAEELISNGVKAVIAAGWAVNDRGARLFAKTFYEAVLRGRGFGDSVRQAREELFNSYPNSNTWGAYQCYGNPGFALESRRAEGQMPRTPEAAVDAVRNIAAQARGADEATCAALEKQIEALERNMQVEWKNGEMLAEVGIAYSQLGRFPKAIDAFQRAFTDPGGRAPVAAAEQYANLLTRLGRDIEDPTVRKRSVAEAKEKLELLMKLFGETPERLSLLGGLHKREAQWAKEHETGETDEHLRNAIEYYSKAVEKTADQTNFYPALNLTALELASGLYPQDEVRRLIDHAERAAGARLECVDDIWTKMSVPDMRLLKRIVDGTLIAEENTQIEEYRAATRRTTVRERNSVLGQIEFLKMMLTDPALREALDRIHTTLKQG